MLMISWPMKANGKPAQPPPKEPNFNKKKDLDALAVETLRRVIDASDDSLDLEKMDSFQKKQFTGKIHDTLAELLDEGGRHLSREDKQRVIQQVTDEIFGYGPINALIQDSTVTEIMINGYDNIYIERKGRLTKSEITFRDNAHVSHTLNKIIHPLGRRLDESCPSVDARLPDGSRVNAIIPPLSLRGPCVTIRKFSTDPFTVDDLVDFSTLTREMADFLAACIRARASMVVSGGTGSGKTTTLNVLSGFIPDTERIVTIEDTAELQLPQDNLVPLESRRANIEGKGEYTIRDLVINSLRMRPDRIVVGEVRGGEALDMLQAMNTGHEGSISTLHSNSPRDALTRLETMVLMAGMELPLKAIRDQIASAVELIVHQSRLSDGTRKITRISEVAGLENDVITLRDVFVFKQEGLDEEGNIVGKHVPTGIEPRVMEKLWAAGEPFRMTDVPGWKEAARALQGDEEEEEEGEKEPASGEEPETPPARAINKGEEGEEADGEEARGEKAAAEQSIPGEAPQQTAETKAPAAETDTGAAAGKKEDPDESARAGIELKGAAAAADEGSAHGNPEEGPTGDVPGEDAPAEEEQGAEESASGEEEENVKSEEVAHMLTLITEAPSAAEIGEEAAFCVTVANEGSEPFHNVQLTDDLLDWNTHIENLFPGQSRTFQVEAFLPGDRGDYLEGNTHAWAENSSGEIIGRQSTYGLEVLVPQITLAVSGPAEAAPGTEVRITLTVTNDSQGVDLFQLQAADELLGWSEHIKSLPAGQTRFFKVGYTVPETAIELSSTVRITAETRFGEPVTARARWSMRAGQVLAGEAELAQAPLRVVSAQGNAGLDPSPEEEAEPWDHPLGITLPLGDDPFVSGRPACGHEELPAEMAVEGAAAVEEAESAGCAEETQEETPVEEAREETPAKEAESLKKQREEGEEHLLKEKLQEELAEGTDSTAMPEGAGLPEDGTREEEKQEGAQGEEEQAVQEKLAAQDAGSDGEALPEEAQAAGDRLDEPEVWQTEPEFPQDAPETRQEEPEERERSADQATPVPGPEEESRRAGSEMTAETAPTASHPESPPRGQQSSPLRLSDQHASTPGESAASNAKRRLAERIPRGMRGIPLPVKAVAGLSLLVEPGDWVDVICMESGPDGQKRCSTLEKAVVLALDGEAECEGENKAATVILAVAPEQIEALVYAGMTGSFYLTLRPPEE